MIETCRRLLLFFLPEEVTWFISVDRKKCLFKLCSQWLHCYALVLACAFSLTHAQIHPLFLSTYCLSECCTFLWDFQTCGSPAGGHPCPCLVHPFLHLLSYCSCCALGLHQAHLNVVVMPRPWLLFSLLSSAAPRSSSAELTAVLLVWWSFLTGNLHWPLLDKPFWGLVKIILNASPVLPRSLSPANLVNILSKTARSTVKFL